MAPAVAGFLRYSSMIVTLTLGALKKFRRTPWRFQQTVERPTSEDLDRFVSTIINVHGRIEAAAVTIDQIVFNTERLTSICPADSKFTHDTSISAQSAEELHSILIAAFWDGLDFICVPAPKPFVFYADHDDWITFYANTKSHLNHVIEPLTSHGFKLVQNWQREL
jgi:hypothetical protein